MRVQERSDSISPMGWLVVYGGHWVHVILPFDALLDIWASVSDFMPVSLLLFRWPWTWPPVSHIFHPFQAQSPCPLLGVLLFLPSHVHSCCGTPFPSVTGQGNLLGIKCHGGFTSQPKWNSWISAKRGSFLVEVNCIVGKLQENYRCWQCQERYKDGSQRVSLWFMRSSRARTGNKSSYNM